jgi:NAD(P)-dependent dehydrogenase (short-subunit alcohol dehydrogenase family)
MAITLSYPEGGAFVSGGTGRVGSGIVTRLAEAGVTVVFSYLGNTASARELEARLCGRGLKVHAVQMDLRDSVSIDAALRFAAESTGRLHSVVFGGGPPVRFARLADFPTEALQEFIQADALGCHRLFHCAVPLLRGWGGGSLTACTTIALKRVIDFDGMSPFSKGAVNALVRQVAAEEAPHGIRCNAVSISWTSPLSIEEQLAEIRRIPGQEGEYVEALMQQLMRSVRLGRPSRPDEAGDLFAFLASDQAAYITGQIIDLDGGLSL